jgi:hypothetical protein
LSDSQDVLERWNGEELERNGKVGAIYKEEMSCSGKG